MRSLLFTAIHHGNKHHRHRRCRPLFQSSPLVTSSSPRSTDDDDENNDENKTQPKRHLLNKDLRICPSSPPLPPPPAASQLAFAFATASPFHPTALKPITNTRYRRQQQPLLRQQQQQQQHYHATTRKEILPFLLVGGIVGLASIYTYKAFQQIDRDWENYYEAVEEYKAMTGIDLENEGGEESLLRPRKKHPGRATAPTSTMSGSGAAENNDANHLSSFFTGGILAIDLGTRRMKLSHLPRRPSSSSRAAAQAFSSSFATTTDDDPRTTTTATSSSSDAPTTPVITVDREGYRYTPSMVWIPPSSSSSSSDDDASQNHKVFNGRLAAARLYDAKEGRTIPLQDIILDQCGVAEGAVIISRAIRNAACDALDQVLGGRSSNSSSSSSKSGSSSSNNKHPLFVLDESLSVLPGSYNVRPVFTYPTARTNTSRRGNDDEEEQEEYPSYYLEQYQRAIANLTSPAGIASFVPEPIAIVVGAEFHNLLPPTTDTNNNSILVVDVGGATTCVSLVRGGTDRDDEEEILYSSSLPFGGDTFIDLLVSHLVNDFFGQQQQQRKEEKEEDTTTTTTSPTLLSMRPKLNDPTALQRLHEASTTAIHELSNKTRSEINVPYLTMDMVTRQPRHLKLGVSRNVVNVEVETWIRNKLVPHLMKMQNHTSSMSLLSQAAPPPTNLSTLFSSTIMCALEETSHTPYMLRAILVVGGGSRIPLVREAMREGVGYLAGEAYAVGSGGKGKRLIMPEGEMCDELCALGAAVQATNWRGN